ncbi:conserved hypothetical protein [Vibrio crassostreae]|nr:conserved hypothetical protein [Vibrio crassostreae]
MNNEQKHWLKVIAILTPFTIYFGYRAIESIEVDNCISNEESRLEYFQSEFAKLDEGEDNKALHEKLTTQLKIVNYLKNSLITEKKEICNDIRKANENKR